MLILKNKIYDTGTIHSNKIKQMKKHSCHFCDYKTNDKILLKIHTKINKHTVDDVIKIKNQSIDSIQDQSNEANLQITSMHNSTLELRSKLSKSKKQRRFYQNLHKKDSRDLIIKVRILLVLNVVIMLCTIIICVGVYGKLGDMEIVRI